MERVSHTPGGVIGWVSQGGIWLYTCPAPGERVNKGVRDLSLGVASGWTHEWESESVMKQVSGRFTAGWVGQMDGE